MNRVRWQLLLYTPLQMATRVMSSAAFTIPSPLWTSPGDRGGHVPGIPPVSPTYTLCRSHSLVPRGLGGQSLGSPSVPHIHPQSLCPSHPLVPRGLGWTVPGIPQCPPHTPSIPVSVPSPSPQGTGVDSPWDLPVSLPSLSPQGTGVDGPRDPPSVPHIHPQSPCPSHPLVPRGLGWTVPGIPQCPPHTPSNPLSVPSPSPQKYGWNGLLPCLLQLSTVLVMPLCPRHSSRPC